MPYHTDAVISNFIYPDDSGFMFDLPPYIALFGAWQEGGTYDIPNLPRYNLDGSWMGYSQWIEKWQKDWRFAAVSDYNATAQLFPEVSDPWMFTEHLFEGTGTASEGGAAVSYGIVEPAFVRPLAVTRDLNAVGTPTSMSFFNTQPSTFVAREEKPLYEIEHQWSSNATGNLFWTSELHAMRWHEIISGSPNNTRFTRTTTQRRVVTMATPAANSGVRIYRHQVWSKSLRWGHSQNIPARLVSMTGPKEFFRPEGDFTGRIVPHVTIKAGTPVYDNISGSATGQQTAFRYEGITIGAFSNDARVTLTNVALTGTDGPAASIFTYPVPPTNTGTNVPLPKFNAGDRARYSFTDIEFTNGDLVHRGCAFWQGQGGTARCTYYSDNETYFASNPPVPLPVTSKSLCPKYDGTTADQARETYKTAGGQCAYYTPQGPRVLLAYEGQAQTQWELNRLRQQLQNPLPRTSGMGGLDGFLADRLIQPVDFNYVPDIDDPNKGFARPRVEISYSPEIVPTAAKETYYDTEDGRPASRDPESDLRIRAGTGFFPIDEKANEPFRGVDTPFFGMVNQINYRVMQNVMHCFKADHCTTIITTRTNPPGFRRGRFSNIDFSSATYTALRPTGYPALDGTSTYCMTGDGNCPYNRLDRRAAEYDENYRILLREILLPFRANGVEAFEGIFEAFLVGATLHLFAEDTTLIDKQAWLAANSTAMCVAVKEESGSPPLLGHFGPVVTANDPDSDESKQWRVFFFYDRPSWDSQHKSSHLAAHLVQFDDEDQPCYMAVPTEDQALMATLYGDAAAVPWLVQLHDDYRQPQGNLVHPTNAKPFWGGRSPQYKNHHHRGREIMSSFGYYQRNSIPTDQKSNQFGGNRWSNAPQEDKGTRGYWTDKDGEWFIDGSSTVGTPVVAGGGFPPFSGFVSLDERIKNIPMDSVGGARPINGVPGLTLKDPTHPEMSRNSDYAAVGTTFSNDTKALLDWFRATHHIAIVEGLPVAVTNWTFLLPEVGEDAHGDPLKPTTAPPTGNFELLPVERYLYRCTVCNLEYLEEEVNLLKTIVAYAPANDAPVGSVIKCHRQDGGHVVLSGAADIIPSSLSRGTVDVWAPPGTTVRHDAFFWKQPQLVSRLTETHISQKLGPYNADGGGYTFANLGGNVEKIGKPPTVTSAGYNPGINRQIIAPWAAAGETLAAIRIRVARWFGLGLYEYQGIYEYAYITRPSSNVGDTRVAIADEAATTVQNDDIVHYERELPDSTRRQVGLLVNVSPVANPSLAAEFLVTHDTPMPVAPAPGANLQTLSLYEQHLREWLLNAVQGSVAQWSSTISFPVNALSAQLAAQGKNPDLGKPFWPGSAPGTPGSTTGAGAGAFDLDERVLAPFGEWESGGLKMASRPHVQRMRNRILPMLAYDLSNDTPLYSAGGDYNATQQQSNSQRYQTRRRDIPQGRLGTVPPQILAASQTGLDHYREWTDPDLLAGPARAYYPVGPTWWRLNQRVGHIRRHGGINPLHLDADPSTVSSSLYEGYVGYGMLPYTGDNIVSTVTFFLHGRIPLDKDVAKAYIVYSVDDGPSAAAIGCKGKYDGYEGPRGTNGQVRPETAVYRGNGECFFEHFHPWITGHESDLGSYAPGAVTSMWSTGGPGYSGFDSRRHWISGGNFDPNFPWLLSSGPVVPQSDTLLAAPDDWRWREADEADRIFTPGVASLGMSFLDTSHGFEFSQPFFQAWSWGQDIVQTVNEHAIWKEMTFDHFDNSVAAYSAQIAASANTIGAVQTFTYFATPFRSQIFNRQMQGIPGWLNFTNYDTSGRFAKQIEIEEKFVDASWANGPQVIVQAGAGSVTSAPGGGSGSGQAGNISRVLDVTQVVTGQYNKRVDRYYQCVLGQKYVDLFNFMRAKTDTNIQDTDPYNKTTSGLANRFHSQAEGNGEYAPLYWWNYRYFQVDAGMWLNDPWHHPPTSNGEVIVPNAGGDPLGESDQGDRVLDVTAWDTQGLEEEDDDYFQYHPVSLSRSDTDGFNSISTPNSTRPIPSQASNAYWRAYASTPTASWFTLDLRQTPYELWRRPWRYEQPTVDASNATCPNTTSCWFAQGGTTIGQLYEQQVHRIWGGTPPSLTSTICPICKTPLTGVILTGSDGITTVNYDPQDVTDSIINAIDADIVSTDGSDSTAKHGFTIEYWNSVAQQWRLLLSVNYLEETNKFEYRQWNGSSFAMTQSDTLPSMFNGWQGDHLGHPIDLPNGRLCHFIVVAGQKVRFKVVRPAQVDRAEPTVNTNYVCVPDVTPGTQAVTVATLLRGMSTYVGRTITLYDATDSNPVVGTIVSAEAASPSGFKLSLNIPTPATMVRCRITWTEYLARATRFRAYGYPYAEGEVVFTPPGYIQDLIFSKGSNEFALTTAPTQVTRVFGSAGDESIELTEAQDNSDAFHWTVATQTYGGVTYKRITAGKWLYDYNRNHIVVPTTYLDDQGKPQSIWGLNASLYADRTLLVDTLPSKISLEYFSGLGVPVEVSVTAHGAGPSYQLDRECVANVAQTGDVVPIGVLTSQLPTMGQSVRLHNLSGERYTLQWRCYNHAPILWESNVAWLSGNELGAGAWDENSVCSAYTGGHGKTVSDLGPYSIIKGKATGKVTLYGAPGVFLSGDLAVYAKAYTERTYHSSDGVVSTHERTGGLKEGVVFFRLMINEPIQSGRKSVSAGIPKLLVYLKERELTKPINPVTGD